MTRIWRIVLTYTLLLGSIRALECPIYCQCYEESGINSIFCINTSRRFVPNYFDFDVKLVNISGNSIPRLAQKSFHNQRYRSLEILDLSRNEITYIENRAFSLLKNLLEINLSRNRLHSLSRKIFTSNRFLNSVVLSGNPITEIKHHAFPLSIFLRRLDFQGCRIRKIDDRALLNSPVLEYLNLKDNDLRSLSLNVLHNSSQLTRLLLDGNPWRCNKDLWLLLKWIRDHEVGNDSLMCVYDETEDAILWDTMSVDNANKFQSSSVWTSSDANSSIYSTQGKRRRSPRSRSGDVSARSEFAGYQVDASNFIEKENERELLNLKNTILSEKSLKRPPVNDEARTELVRKFEPASGETISIFSYNDPHETERSIQDYFDKIESLSPESMEQTTIMSQIPSLEANESNDDSPSENQYTYEIVDMNVLLSLICIEFALLLVLLYILYKLWKWNKQTYEQGINASWNNLDKNMKPYHDISSPGYKRYSLSDDNFSLNDNKEENSKCDAESGYLSYHRYNSIEGAEAETNNSKEFSHYNKRYPPQEINLHSQSLNNNDSGIGSVKRNPDSSMMELHSPESMRNEKHKQASSIRRNSSFRSLGRRTKINLLNNRSISADSATNYYYTYNPRSTNNY